MDILKMIQHLLDERKRIDATIARLEALSLPGDSGSKSAPGGKRRGRKNMSLTEREEVSRRMRNYWEARRRQAAQLASEEDPEQEQAAGHAAGSTD